MTWAELHGVLRGRGLIQADAAVQAEAGVGLVTGIAYDSRQVQRAEVFVALKGQRADGTEFARQAIERGAAAVVVERGEFEIGCIPFVLASDGEHGDLLYAERDERLLHMAGQEVYRHAVERMVEATREALRRADMTVDDVDVLIVHQANQRIIDAAARRLGVPEEKVFANVATIANTSSASIPLALHHAELAGALKPGDIVALAAFGGGFVWGAGIVKWKERVHASA
jgi:3-oxoacyl-[acyl-carrier-protein] synthase-3